MKSSLRFGALTLELYPEKLLWVPELRLLCASDMHLEKGSFFSQFETLLPPYDSHDTLERLSQAIAKFKPEIFIALGDSFHDRHAAHRLDCSLKAQLNDLIAKVSQWVWIVGNHDPAIDAVIAGERREEIAIGDICFRHELKPQESRFEVSGHFHPKVKVVVKGHGISGPCFVRSAKRLIMPSFGSYTGGLSIASQDFQHSLPEPIEQVIFIHNGVTHAFLPAMIG